MTGEAKVPAKPVPDKEQQEAQCEAERQLMLEALDEIGLTPVGIAHAFGNILKDPEATPRDKRRVLADILDVRGLRANRTKKVKTESTQRSLRLTLGEGRIGNGVDLERLSRLSPADRREAVAKLTEIEELLEGKNDDGEDADQHAGTPADGALQERHDGADGGRAEQQPGDLGQRHDVDGDEREPE